MAKKSNYRIYPGALIPVCDDLQDAATYISDYQPMKEKENEDVVQENPEGWIPELTIPCNAIDEDGIAYFNPTSHPLGQVEAWLKEKEGKVGKAEIVWDQTLKITFYKKEDYLEFVNLFPWVLSGDKTQ